MVLHPLLQIVSTTRIDFPIPTTQDIYPKRSGLSRFRLSLRPSAALNPENSGRRS
jgi:hypothetical protein